MGWLLHFCVGIVCLGLAVLRTMGETEDTRVHNVLRTSTTSECCTMGVQTDHIYMAKAFGRIGKIGTSEGLRIDSTIGT